MTHQDWLWVAYGAVGLALSVYMFVLIHREERKARADKLAAAGEK
jgi:hypothetical protein